MPVFRLDGANRLGQLPGNVDQCEGHGGGLCSFHCLLDGLSAHPSVEGDAQLLRRPMA